MTPTLETVKQYIVLIGVGIVVVVVYITVTLYFSLECLNLDVQCNISFIKTMILVPVIDNKESP